MKWLDRILFGLGVFNLMLAAINLVVTEGSGWVALTNFVIGLMCLYFAEGDNNG